MLKPSPARDAPTTVAVVAERVCMTGSTIYRNLELCTVIEHHRQSEPDGKIAAITDELDTLRAAIQTLADAIRRHDTQLR